MKRIVPTLLVMTLLTGCAAAPPVGSSAVQEIDHTRMAAINRAAQLAGVQVIWINAPRKAVHAAGS